MKNQSVSIKKNFILQFLYQGITLIVPLIMAPYLTRTLCETQLGNFTFAYSIAYYFVLLAMLGIAVYGQRVIAQNSDDNIKLRKVFWSLYITHIFISLIAIALFVLYFVFFVNENKTIYIILTLYVLSALFDITWFFYGIEDYKSVVMKNAFVKTAECVAIFIFIKSPLDINKYTAIYSISIAAGQAIMLPQAIKRVPFIRFDLSDMRQHIKPLLVFAIASVASMLYTVFDKTLLGIMTTKETVAYYEYSDKIIGAVKSLIIVAGMVMYPRACRLVSQGKIAEQKKNLYISLQIVAFIGMGSMAGLCALGRELAILYYGESFNSCGLIIMMLSPMIYVIGLGEVLRKQYLVPNHLDKQYTICIVISAVINIVLSMLFIPNLGAYGAVIGTTIAELFGLVYQMVLSKKFASLQLVTKSTIPYVVFAAVMFTVIVLLKNIINAYTIMGFIGCVVIGAVVYIAFSLVYLLLTQKDMLKELIKFRR